MFIKNKKDSVIYYTSDKIEYPHAFSTRYGGMSVLEHTKEMNFGFDKGDPDDIVDANYKIFANAVGISEKRAFATQIHSASIVYADYPGDKGEADGFVTDKSGIALTVKTADCLPILFADPDAGIIGAAHAGWRGSVLKIQQKCVLEMIRMGARAERIRAAIGPSIHPCHFEVSRDFESLISDKIENSERYIEERDGKFFCDLQTLNRDLLTDVGVLFENIDICALCTACDTESFYSHRIMGYERGLMCSMISIS